MLNMSQEESNSRLPLEVRSSVSWWLSDGTWGRDAMQYSGTTARLLNPALFPEGV